MKTSIATVSLSGGLSEKLRSDRRRRIPRRRDLRERSAVLQRHAGRRAPRKWPISASKSITFQPFRDFEGMPEPQRERAFDRAERKFDLMQELGCDLLMVCSNVSPESLGGIDRAAADFRELGERAAKRGLRVGFEALAWGRHINDYRDAWEVVRRADHPAVGLVLDTFHILRAQAPISSRMRAIPARPHLPGAARRRAAARHGLTCPGAGTSAISPARATCRCSTSWRRCRRPATTAQLSLEIFNDQFRAGSPRSVAVDGQRSLRLPAGPAARDERQRPRAAFRRCRRARNAWASSSSNSPSTTRRAASSSAFSPASASASAGAA